jgi:hypothetical protein
MDLQLGDLFELPQSVQRGLASIMPCGGKSREACPRWLSGQASMTIGTKQQTYTTILFEYQNKFKRMQVPIPVDHKYVKVDGGEDFRKRMMASQKADMEASMQFGLRGNQSLALTRRLFVLDGKGQLAASV